MATFTALRRVLDADNIEVTKQLEIMTTWSRKCHTQTKLLGFCALRNVFSAHRTPQDDTTGHGRLQNHPDCKGVTFTGAEHLATTESFVVTGASCVAVYHKSSSSTTPSTPQQPPTVLIFDTCRLLDNCHQSDTSTDDVVVPVDVRVDTFIADNLDGPAVLDPQSSGRDCYTEEISGRMAESRK
ncbi:hypothetical protein T484DRAFT_1896251 [Baffinella frigidus]|nr:hypothetical protein T484DRAFT_1896251 [Cryptophyta sp. CCMP2293]